MLSSGHEHSFICSLSFNVITVLKKQQKSALPQRPALLFFGVQFKKDSERFWVQWQHIFYQETSTSWFTNYTFVAEGSVKIQGPQTNKSCWKR